MKNFKNSFSILIFSAALLLSNVVLFLPSQISTAKAVTQTNTETVNAASEPESSESHALETGAENEEHESEENDQSVIGLFGLNWKLFLAQLVNFAIVLFVLWKWVFKPVVSGMEARTKKIEDSLNTADKVNKEKEEFDQWKSTEMSSARQEAAAIITEAKKTATQTKDQILEQARTEQQQILEQSKNELEKQKQQMILEAKGEVANLVIESTEKLLRAKLDTKADTKLIESTLKEQGNG